VGVVERDSGRAGGRDDEWISTLATDIARLNAIEKQIIERFIHRQRVGRDMTQVTMSVGDRVADRVAAFGGSWSFIFLAVACIFVWLSVNTLIAKAFDPYPFILLNLVLSCLAALQAPVIMMSQNRQAALRLLRRRTRGIDVQMPEDF
jgi:uncharacterized membrane protein